MICPAGNISCKCFVRVDGRFMCFTDPVGYKPIVTDFEACPWPSKQRVVKGEIERIQGSSYSAMCHNNTDMRFANKINELVDKVNALNPPSRRE